VKCRKRRKANGQFMVLASGYTAALLFTREADGELAAAFR